MKSSPAVVLVTGASRGLGRGIAVQLARDGFSVAINYVRSRGGADATRAQCEASRSDPRQRFPVFQADIGEAGQRAALVLGVLEELGAIHALVNNAGVGPAVRKDITEADEESFDRLLRINLKGPHFLTQAVVTHWLAAKTAAARAQASPEAGSPPNRTVVFVTSISAHTASVQRPEYCISKAGLSMSRQLWAVRLASEGIRVYEIRPGIMATDMTRGVKAKYDRLLAEGLVPQQRWGTPEDVGLAVSALLEGKLAFSTGTVVDVDGGFHLRRL